MTLNIFLQLTKSSIKLTSAVMSFFSRTAGIRLLPLKEWIGYWQDNHREGKLFGERAFSPKKSHKTT